MYIAFTLTGAVAAGLALWFATSVQHRLYTRPEHRFPGDTGTRRLARRLGVAGVAALAAGIALRPEHYEPLPAAVAACAVAVLLLAASTDLERKLIPNRITYPFALVAAALCWVWPDRSASDIVLGGLAALGIGVAMFVAGEVFAIVLRVRATPLGLGDVKLMLVMGLLLGWPMVLPAFVIGVFAAGIPAVFFTVAGQGKRVFPYGPFLVLGALIPLLFPGRFL